MILLNCPIWLHSKWMGWGSLDDFIELSNLTTFQMDGMEFTWWFYWIVQFDYIPNGWDGVHLKLRQFDLGGAIDSINFP